MFAHMEAVWDLPLPPTHKLVALRLAKHANEAGLCWPSPGSLILKTGVSKATLYRVLPDLRQVGVIAPAKTPGGRKAWVMFDPSNETAVVSLHLMCFAFFKPPQSDEKIGYPVTGLKMSFDIEKTDTADILESLAKKSHGETPNTNNMEPKQSHGETKKSQGETTKSPSETGKSHPEYLKYHEGPTKDHEEGGAVPSPLPEPVVFTPEGVLMPIPEAIAKALKQAGEKTEAGKTRAMASKAPSKLPGLWAGWVKEIMGSTTWSLTVKEQAQLKAFAKKVGDDHKKVAKWAAFNWGPLTAKMKDLTGAKAWPSYPHAGLLVEHANLFHTLWVESTQAPKPGDGPHHFTPPPVQSVAPTKTVEDEGFDPSVLDQ